MEFINKLWGYIKAGWEKVKGAPIIKPLWGLVYSRKALIAGAVVTFLLTEFPKLAPAKDELTVVMVQVTGIVLTAIGTSIGIAMEDAAAKSAPALTTLTASLSSEDDPAKTG